MSRRLAVLCPQLYVGMDMRVTGCNHCDNWSADADACQVYVGCEHLPVVAASEQPECPIAARCQHQIQSGRGVCVVRARGMVCESALRYAGVRESENHPLGFHAMVVV